MVRIIEIELENELLDNISKVHTTALGAERILRNMGLGNEVDVVAWCVDIIQSPDSTIVRRGKNYYIENKICIITVNAYSYTIITVHKTRK